MTTGNSTGPHLHFEALAREADEQLLGVKPDPNESRIGNHDEHVGRGVEDDPGEDPID